MPNHGSRRSSFQFSVVVAAAFFLLVQVLSVEKISGVVGGSSLPFPGVSIQGRLRTNAGAPLLANPATIVVKLYDAETSGNLLYSDEHSINLNASNGYYSLPFGMGTNPQGLAGALDIALRAYPQAWFTLNVNGDGDMSPRTPLLASAFAINSQAVDGSRYVKAFPVPNSCDDAPDGYADGAPGDLWYDLSTDSLKYYSGAFGNWQPVDSGGGGGSFLPLAGGTMAGNIDMGGYTIFVTGGSIDMGGGSLFNANSINASVITATTSISGDGSGLTNLYAGAINGGILDTAFGGTGLSSYNPLGIFYALDASTMVQAPVGGPNQILAMDGSGTGFTWIAPSGTGDFLADGSIPMTGPLNMGNNLIQNVLDPVVPTDAATMGWTESFFLKTDGTSGMIAPLEGFDGAASAPGFTFSGDNTTGLFLSSGELGLTVGGTETMLMNPTQVQLSIIGSMTTPAFAFTGSNLGFYRSGASNIAFTDGLLGSNLAEITDSGIVPLSIPGDPAPLQGAIYYNTSTNKLMVSDGSVWIEAGGGLFDTTNFPDIVYNHDFGKVGIGPTAFTTPLYPLHVHSDPNNPAASAGYFWNESGNTEAAGVTGEVTNSAGSVWSIGGKFLADDPTLSNNAFGVVGLAGSLTSVDPTTPTLGRVGVFGQVNGPDDESGYAGYFSNLTGDQFGPQYGIYAESTHDNGSSVERIGGSFYASGAIGSGSQNVAIVGIADNFVDPTGAELHVGGEFRGLDAAVQNLGVAGIAGSIAIGPIDTIVPASDVGVFGYTDSEDGYAAYFQNIAVGTTTTPQVGISAESFGAGQNNWGGAFFASGATFTNFGISSIADGSTGSALGATGGLFTASGAIGTNAGIMASADNSTGPATNHIGGQFSATGASSVNYGVIGLNGPTAASVTLGDFAIYGETDLSTGYGVFASNSTGGAISGAALWADVTDPSSTNIIARFTTVGGANEQVAIKADGGIVTAAAPTTPTPNAIYSDSGAKAWVTATGAGAGNPTIDKKFNIASITRVGPGQYTVTFDTPMFDPYYAVVGTIESQTNSYTFSVDPSTKTPGGFTIKVNPGAPTDINGTEGLSFVVMGDQ